MTKFVTSRLATVFVCAALSFLTALPAAAKGADSQVDFGVKMAQRGLWSEALFRFQQAERLAPGNAKILNNVAVAYEALGRFEEALAAYQEALKVAPSNRELRSNYSRFVEFYQSFRAPDEEQEADSTEPAPEPPQEDEG